MMRGWTEYATWLGFGVQDVYWSFLIEVFGPDGSTGAAACREEEDRVDCEMQFPAIRGHVCKLHIVRVLL